MDALFRQQQAILRTLPTPSSVVAEAVKLWGAWRKSADRPFLRSALLVLIAILFTAMTVAASIFSTLIVNTGTIDVLVDSTRCAAVGFNGTAWRTYGDALTQAAPTYAQKLLPRRRSSSNLQRLHTAEYTSQSQQRNLPFQRNHVRHRGLYQSRLWTRGCQQSLWVEPSS